MTSLNKIIVKQFEAYLGPNTAATAVKTFSKKALGLEPEEITYAHIPALLDAMRPMLRTLLGQTIAETLLQKITEALK